MIASKIDTSLFIQTFKKKFSNFCKKSPLLLTYIITDQSVKVYEYNKFEDLMSHDTSKYDYILEYSFDFIKDVKENIADIKQALLPLYPVIYQELVIKENLSAKERNDLVELGKMSVDEAAEAKRDRLETISYRIEKVIIERDEIIIVNLADSEEVHRYKIKIPVSIFMKKIRFQIPSEEQFIYFKSKSEFIGKISFKEPVDHIDQN